MTLTGSLLKTSRGYRIGYLCLLLVVEGHIYWGSLG